MGQRRYAESRRRLEKMQSFLSGLWRVERVRDYEDIRSMLVCSACSSSANALPGVGLERKGQR